PSPPLFLPLSLHDALPISPGSSASSVRLPIPPSSLSSIRRSWAQRGWAGCLQLRASSEHNFFVRAPRALEAACPPLSEPAFTGQDRKSTRLNSSHDQISYA